MPTNTTTANNTETNGVITEDGIITAFPVLSTPAMPTEGYPITEQAIQYQREDPIFAKLAQLVYNCMNHLATAKSRAEIDASVIETCDTAIPQGVAQFCDFATLDLAKCDAAKSMQFPWDLWTATLLGVA
jgi:hypothetical protein